MIFDYNNVYTCANADELQIGCRGYFADNLKELQLKVENDSNAVNELAFIYGSSSEKRFLTSVVVDDSETALPYALFYKLTDANKNEYVPFKNCDELIEQYTKTASNALPFIWVKEKINPNAKHLIVGFYDDVIHVDDDWIKLNIAFGNFVFLDDTPFGKQV